MLQSVTFVQVQKHIRCNLADAWNGRDCPYQSEDSLHKADVSQRTEPVMNYLVDQSYLHFTSKFGNRASINNVRIVLADGEC